MRAYWLDSGVDIEPQYLRMQGVLNEELPLEPDGYQPRLDELRERRGYGTQDQIELRPETENLEAICAKFKDEHLHTDDEVRFVLEGEGVFDIRSQDDRWMRVVVEAGDLIVVPENRNHRFFLTDSKTIRCVRLFQDPAGWTPVYRETP
jgi:1,2-dihydroxy-3-keto-5-methylthiopentene dioxygenase